MRYVFAIRRVRAALLAAVLGGACGCGRYFEIEVRSELTIPDQLNRLVFAFSRPEAPTERLVEREFRLDEGEAFPLIFVFDADSSVPNRLVVEAGAFLGEELIAGRVAEFEFDDSTVGRLYLELVPPEASQISNASVPPKDQN